MNRKTLEETLVRAEAHLQSAVKTLASGDGDTSTASEKVEKARASCRDARAALTRQIKAED